jgi:glycosyltransferase involved in cell wall biosynthesis
MSTPIALCMVVKNEAETIEAAIRSARPHLDEVNVLDTGSTDGTLEILERLAAEEGPPVRVEHATFVDFEVTREQSFAMASREIEWLMWMDADERLIGAKHLSALAAAANASGVDRVKAALQYIDIGLPPQWRERVVRRGAGEWKGCGHSVWRSEDERCLFAHPAAFRSTHNRPLSPPERWLPLSKLSAARDPEGLAELGGVLMTTGDLPGAVVALTLYLRLVDRGVERMRLLAARSLGAALHLLGRHEEAVSVETFIGEHMRAFPANYDLDVLNAALGSFVLLRTPDESVGPVLAVA